MNTKLIKDLDFAAKLAISEPLTESAQDVVKRYRGYMYTNDCNCAIVNNFIREARAYGYDKGMSAILESIESFIAANPISWKLATACESVSAQNSTYGSLAKIGIDKAQQLLEMKESDVVAYIKAGALKGVKFIPEFRDIAKDVYRTTVSESAQAVNYEMSTPFSLEFVNESTGEHFVSILGKTYSITESVIKEATCEDVTFNKVNAHLSAFTLVNEDIEYKYYDYKFSINEGKLTLTKGETVLSVFENATDMLKYCDTLSRAIPYGGAKFMSICGAVAEVFENAANIVMVDQARVFRNANNTYAVVIEAKDNVLVNANGEVSDYKFMIEACDSVQKNCGTDIKYVYETRINEDVKKGNPEQYAAIQEELERSKDAQAQIRYNKIAELAESLKDDPAAIAVLNTLTKELRLLESKNE